MEKKIFLRGRMTYLRAIEPEDLDLVYNMENDPEMWSVSSFTVPYSRFMMKQYIQESQSDVFADKQLRLMVVRIKDDKAVGTIDITDFSPLHGRGELGVAIHKDCRRNGFATEALGLLVDYAFDFLHMHQLYVHVPVDNVWSIRLFLNAGFEPVGVLRGWNKVGEKYVDVSLLQKIRCKE